MQRIHHEHLFCNTKFQKLAWTKPLNRLTVSYSRFSLRFCPLLKYPFLPSSFQENLEQDPDTIK